MSRTLIVPGLDGSAEPHWQHWWALTDPEAILVDLPDPSQPSPARWETELAGMVIRHPDSVLVGHSLGAVVIARLLSKWPQLRIRAALLVAPAEPDSCDRIAAFGPLPERVLPVAAQVVASRNDPWMRFDRAELLARAWGAGLVDLGDSGHINAAAGFGPWPRGKALRDALLEQTADQPRRRVPA